MSALAINDENLEDGCSRKLSGSEVTCDIFSTSQPTGRPSILRQSQMENLPSKSVPKAVTVCFQTPRRDQVTKRIMSPSNLKMSGLVESTGVHETLSKKTASLEGKVTDVTVKPNTGANDISKTEAPCSNYDMIIQIKGGYQMDFDNLEAVNPFKASNLMGNSPVKTQISADLQTTVQSEYADPFKASNLMGNSPVTTQISADLQTTVQSEYVDPFKASNLMGNSPVTTQISADLQTTVQSEYADTFKASNLMGNSPVKIPISADLQTTVQSEYADPFKASNLMGNSPVKTQISAHPQTTVQSQDFTTSTEEEPEMVVEPTVTLDETLPFVSYTENSLADVSTEVHSTESTVIIDLKQAGEEAHSEAGAVDEEEVLYSKASSSFYPSQLVKTSPVTSKGSFNFDFDSLDSVSPFQVGGSKLQNSPVNKPLPSNDPLAAPEAPQKFDLSKELGLPEMKPTALTQDNPKSSYNFDIDPFGMDEKMENAPKKDLKSSSSLTGKIQIDNSVQEDTGPRMAPENIPTQKEEAEQAGPRGEDVTPVIVDSMMPATAEQDKTLPEDCNATTSGIVQERSPIPDQPTWQTLELSTNSQNSLTTAEEEFVPGATFMSADFGQIDYLEQFGSTIFKESALRKQSLYLKFDPLLKESPKKATLFATELHQNPLPTLFTSRPGRQGGGRAGAEEQNTEKTHGLSFLEDFPAPAAAPLVTDPSTFDSLVTTLPKPIRDEGAIIEVLMYSQSDMDAVIAKVLSEAKERNDELLQDNQEMGKIMADFEETVSQVIADSRKQKAEHQEELKKVVQEKEQVMMDLNALENSFAELFKRLEKRNQVIEGYKKNEDILKKCAQDYLARIKKEEQRYQTLKVHAEEKIGLANGEIAQVRSKLKAETSALQAQLRREQLKVQSLERSLEQKVKETEELTKLCDDLIVNVQKR
ncbi:hypothetical protein AAFF_G00135310 [Aldrovandia affinis]|uniref:Transforming acidic coiled-coil-containing protein C-terminal domain-containing protein n=1 Tax=Aldrovandia affinis TaxID=143900 RepID=A0AAD7RQA8_9TELE|nr:hypothetical protein AAFF_G00135310 [Aldrovandia affinis]